MSADGTAPISRAAVITALGLTQILAWGSSYYLLTVLATPIAADTGWPFTWIIGALSVGLLIAGLVSPLVGRTIGAKGGRTVLALSALLIAAGQIVLGLAPSLPVFIAGWLVIGAGMGAGLYDAAFATLGSLYGNRARSAITLLTLWGGFASTVCWPLSAYLVETIGWRGTCFAYAGIQLGFSLPLILTVIPRTAPAVPADAGEPATDLALSPLERKVFALLAGILVLASAMTTIISVHLLTLLQAQGVALAAAVFLGTLIGPAQVGGRLIEMASGGRHHPMWSLTAALTLIAAGMAMLCTGFGGAALALALYGAGNGVYSIARGTLPLALFGPARYAPLMGRLARPALISQAIAPLAGAFVLERAGADQALGLLAVFGVANLFLMAALYLAHRTNDTRG